MDWVNLTFCGLRASLAVVYLSTLSLVPVLCGVVELVAVVLSLGNSFLGSEVDRKGRAWVVPACYLCSMFFVPAAGAVWAVALQCVVLVGVLILEASLGFAYSMGRSSFLGVVSGGPYSIVRHPMWAALLASRLLLTLDGLYLWNVGAFALFVGLVVWSIYSEERFFVNFISIGGIRIACGGGSFLGFGRRWGIARRNTERI